MFAEKRDFPQLADERLGRWILGGAAAVAIAFGIWYWQKSRDEEPVEEPVVEAPVATSEEAVKNPIAPSTDDAANLPPAERVAALVGTDKFAAMFVPDDFVRNLVTTVDNLSRPKVATRMLPVKPPGGEFVTAGEGGNIVLGARNFERYDAWVKLIDSLDPDAVVALYRQLYPQLQAAYTSLGNPESYFNDRVIAVIDHLLAMPEPPANLALVRPNVFYEFADPQLEAESAGRKLLLRMGPGNAARVKMKLRDIRDRIATKP